MIQVSSPHSLFNGQKVYRISKTVEKWTKNHAKDGSIKLILIYEDAKEELPAEWKVTLDKLTKACKFTLEQTICLNGRFNPVSLGDLQNSYLPKVVLIFGEVNISRNLGNLKKNYPYEMNGVKILRTETLEKLEKEGNEKKALWTSLQKMLDIS